MKEKSASIEPLVDIKELSEATGLKVSFIEDAKTDKGLPFYELGRSIRYRISEVEVWIQKRRKIKVS
jgi:excisionase family DNA binding protein